MINPFIGRAAPLSGPAKDVFPITPDDALDLPNVAVALYVETGGALRITTVSGAIRTLSVDDMCILPVGVLRVHATGTTASAIHGFSLA
ncbi:spike base protein, RCAP_Rcc01079 family [Celeribacter litoreus]|uniref:spike base protein, RCAP_Rcc01079 family n=1 Tax=Celeribacter litoreus TaxID=2876714 RepID=UPI001CCBA466|nr:hypothetical protein [Celeribacter litoreus]MCA0044094.1 hypothetical protein [Celeribacter litoreus]